MPFEPLVSSGIPKGFPEQLHILKENDNNPTTTIVSENSSFQEDSEDNIVNDFTKTVDSNYLLRQNRKLKIVIVILSGLFLIAVASLLIMIGQLVKKEEKPYGIINCEDTSVTAIDESVYTETNLSESKSISVNHDSSVNIQNTETYSNNDILDNEDGYEVDESTDIHDIDDGDELEGNTDIPDTEDGNEVKENTDILDTEDGNEVDEDKDFPENIKSNDTLGEEVNIEDSTTSEEMQDLKNEEGAVEEN